MSEDEKKQVSYESEDVYEARQEKINNDNNNDSDDGIGCGGLGSIIGCIVTVIIIIAKLAAVSSSCNDNSSSSSENIYYPSPTIEYVTEKIPEDPVEAFKYHLREAERGDKVHQYNLGICYDTGSGTERDEKKAFEWYKKAAEQGMAEAQYNVGVTYWNGEVVNRNIKEAKIWFEKAARNGNKEAQNIMKEEFGETIIGIPQHRDYKIID